MEEQIRKKLKEVIDPEIGINVVDLGFIYEVKSTNGKVEVLMTLTAPGCPLAGVMIDQVKEKVLSIPGVEKAEVKLTFDPPWTPERMDPKAAEKMGFGQGR